MSQGTDTTLGGAAEQGGIDDDGAEATTESHHYELPTPRSGFPAPTPTGGFPAPTPAGGFPGRTPTPTGGFPAPRPHPPQHPWTGGWAQPVPTQTGSWSQAAYYGDEEEAPREGNGAAVASCVLAILGLLLSLRPLVFGSNAMAADTYVAIAIAVLALVLGVVGARIPRRRPASVTGIALSIVALLLIAVIPTL